VVHHKAIAGLACSIKHVSYSQYHTITTITIYLTYYQSTTYCTPTFSSLYAALPYSIDGKAPILTSIYQVRKDVTSGAGLTVTTVVAASGSAVDVLIGGVFPDTQYRVFCYTEDASLYGMDINAIKGG